MKPLFAELPRVPRATSELLVVAGTRRPRFRSGTCDQHPLSQIHGGAPDGNALMRLQRATYG
jgi:hypothetical protein